MPLFSNSPQQTIIREGYIYYDGTLNTILLCHVLPVLTWYFRVSLQSTSSWSRFRGSSGIPKSMTSFSCSGCNISMINELLPLFIRMTFTEWKSRILTVLSFWMVMWSRSISTTLFRNSLVLVSVSPEFPV